MSNQREECTPDFGWHPIGPNATRLRHGPYGLDDIFSIKTTGEPDKSPTSKGQVASSLMRSGTWKSLTMEPLKVAAQCSFHLASTALLSKMMQPAASAMPGMACTGLGVRDLTALKAVPQSPLLQARYTVHQTSNTHCLRSCLMATLACCAALSTRDLRKEQASLDSKRPLAQLGISGSTTELHALNMVLMRMNL